MIKSYQQFIASGSNHEHNVDEALNASTATYIIAARTLTRGIHPCVIELETAEQIVKPSLKIGDLCSDIVKLKKTPYISQVFYNDGELEITQSNVRNISELVIAVSTAIRTAFKNGDIDTTNSDRHCQIKVDIPEAPFLTTLDISFKKKIASYDNPTGYNQLAKAAIIETVYYSGDDECGAFLLDPNFVRIDPSDIDMKIDGDMLNDDRSYMKVFNAESIADAKEILEEDASLDADDDDW